MSESQGNVELMKVPEVEFHAPAVGPRGNGAGAMAIATTRAAQEVQAAIMMAKYAPRDQVSAYARIMASCKRRTLAEQSSYSYKRGTTQVTGPTIRLAEEVARNWGNMDWGFVELDQAGGESTVMAYAWDLETNTRSTRVFKVPHVRYTKSGTVVLSDPRDIYEVVANQAARRIRAAILALIPGDVMEAAVAQCDKTLTSGHAKSLPDRVRECAAFFHGIGVTRAQLETHVQHSLESVDERELLALGKLYNAIKNGYTTVQEAFPPTAEVVDDPQGAKRGAVQKAKELVEQRRQGKKVESPTAPPAVDPDSVPAAGSDAIDAPSPEESDVPLTGKAEQIAGVVSHWTAEKREAFMARVHTHMASAGATLPDAIVEIWNRDHAPTTGQA